MTLDYHCPTIEENIPLPTNAKEAFPSLSPTDELNMRANVIKLLSDLTESPISPTEANVVEASGVPVFLVEGEFENIKITRPLDMAIANYILTKRFS